MKKLKIIITFYFMILSLNSLAVVDQAGQFETVLGEGETFTCTGFCSGPSLTNAKNIAINQADQNAIEKCEEKGYADAFF